MNILRLSTNIRQITLYIFHAFLHLISRVWLENYLRQEKMFFTMLFSCFVLILFCFVCLLFWFFKRENLKFKSSQGEVSGGGFKGRFQGEVSGGGPRRRPKKEFFLINTMLLFIFQPMISFWTCLWLKTIDSILLFKFS